MRKAGTFRFAALLGLLLGSSAVPADIPGCPKSDMPPAALKGLEKAAKRESAEPLDHATVYYCLYRDFARATVDTIPVPQSDGSELLGTLMCSGAANRARGWFCEVDRYRAIRVAPGVGQPEVHIEVAERASLESTREHARQAFDLLNQAERVQACSGAGYAQTTGSLRAMLARRYGPYRLVISREGFALLRGGIQVRMRPGNEFDPRARIQCWEEMTPDE
jgi:hypothetical protein